MLFGRAKSVIFLGTIIIEILNKKELKIKKIPGKQFNDNSQTKDRPIEEISWFTLKSNGVFF